MSEVAGTSPMPEYLRKVLEEWQHEIILYDRPGYDAWYGAKWEIAGWPRFVVPKPDPMKIIITDVS